MSSKFGRFEQFNNLVEIANKLSLSIQDYLSTVIVYTVAVELRHLDYKGLEYVRNNKKLLKLVQTMVDKQLFQFEDLPDLRLAKKFIDAELSSGYTGRDIKMQVGWFRFFVNYFGSFDELIEFSIWAFSVSELWCLSYGGAAWHNIAKHYIRLKRPSDEVFESVLQLRHNTGSLFAKIGHLQ